MKRVMLILCMLLVIVSSSFSAYAAEEPIVLKESSTGSCFTYPIEGEELENIRNRDVVVEFEVGRLAFSKELTNYLIDKSEGELTISYFNMFNNSDFIQEDYLFVSSVLFIQKNGSAIEWPERLGPISLTANLNYPVKKEGKLTYYYHAGSRGDREEIQGVFDKDTASVTFEMSGPFGHYAVFYDDPTLTGRPEENTSVGIYIAAGVVVFIALIGSLFLIRRKKG